jgi:hypothetical protein
VAAAEFHSTILAKADAIAHDRQDVPATAPTQPKFVPDLQSCYQSQAPGMDLLGGNEHAEQSGNQ